jgi:hypothetical protein
MPGLKSAPLQPEKKLQKRLETLCATAHLSLPKGKRESKNAVAFMGKQLQLEHNRFGLKCLAVDGTVLRLAYEDGNQEEWTMGYGDWRYNTLAGLPYYSINSINRMQGFNHGFTAAVVYAWKSPTVLEVKIHYVDWISGMTILIDFGKNEATLCDTYPNSKPATIQFTMQ